MKCWMISWQKKPYVLPYLIDVDSPEMAAELTLRLATIPSVYDVKVTETTYEEDPELKARIWARVNARMREYQMIEYALSEAGS